MTPNGDASGGIPELRKDPVTGSWVIFSPERSRRPAEFEQGEGHETPRELCPFCPSHDEENRRLELIRFPPISGYEGQPWAIKVLKDKYPILSSEEVLHRFGEGMYDLMSGYGYHEVIVESPVHDDSFVRYSDTHVRDLLSVYQNRSLELSSCHDIRQILITRNSGADAGAKISHPHSHIVGLPIVPQRLVDEIEGCRSYFRFKDRCVYCDIIVQEREDASRLVLENDCFVAFCDWAARFPFEVTIAPRVHLSRFETIRPNELAHLADVLKGVLTSIKGCLSNPAMNFIFHTAPAPQARTEDIADVAKYFHWHIEIIPKMTRVAGFEWGTGFYINPTLPEDSARYLREYLDEQKRRAGVFPLSRTQPSAMPPRRRAPGSA